ncbi:hypothetical protein JZU71_00310, partial [bacterium]|nr:hypothetical protein [bacterium]
LIHPQVKIVVGNSVATSIVETLLTKTEADIAVISEGDITVPELLHAIETGASLATVNGIAYVKEGTVVWTEARALIKNISDLPHIDFDIFDAEKYIAGARNYIDEPLPLPREQIRALPVNT